MRVVVDAMGTDHAPGPEVSGALRAVRASDDLTVTLVGDAARLESELARAGRESKDRIAIAHASEVVTMHDHPGQAFRAKPDSSMRVAVQRVHDGEGDAVVSAGNSGAMLACAIFVLGRLPDIERPAIVTVLPTPAGPLVLCDAGANTEPKPSQLAQFALIGAAYDRVVHGRTPRVGLLSNGAEPGKGTPLTREAHALLTKASGAFQYIGYVEGSDLFRGVVDVVATDGFTGNVVLKTCEGIAEGMFGLVKQELEKTPMARLGSSLARPGFAEPRSTADGGAESTARPGFAGPRSTAEGGAESIVAPALRGLAKRIDYTEIGGALLAGVTRPAVIAHGRSDAAAIASAIRAAARFAQRSLPGQLAAAITALG